MAELAASQNVATLVGLQARQSPQHLYIQKLINEKDGENSVTRDVKKEILELGFPQQFPKN